MAAESEVTYETIDSVLQMSNPTEKCAAAAALQSQMSRFGMDRSTSQKLRPMVQPGRPERPELVEPHRVPRRRLGSEAGRAALVHAIAHIEFNAINLALDAAYRFRDMPDQYYCDWISVAADEARHFELLEKRLRLLDCGYGDFSAHNGLWQMAEQSADSCLERMALVPRVLEARGLDVTPGMIERLRATGDIETIAALEIILAEEVRHVEIGSHWFQFCCAREGVEPEETFLRLLKTRFKGRVKGPFNTSARLAAGFSAREIHALEGLS